MEPIFIDNNLYLNQITPDDADEMFKAINTQREYLGKWLPFVEHTIIREDTLAFIEMNISSPNFHIEPVFTINYSDTFAGVIALKGSDILNRKTEIGYWLSEPFQHKGIMIRSVKALMKYTFDKLKFNRIQIKCAVGNLPSIRIPKSLNYRFEGIERQGELLSGDVYTDLVVYSFLAEDWNE